MKKTMLVKLTYPDGRTRPNESNETQWGEGVTHIAQGDPVQALCTDGWIHVYEGLGGALLMNPLHASIPDPVAWEATGEIGTRDGWRKAGCRTVTTVRKIDYILPPAEALVTTAIYCALAVYAEPGWVAWAEGWLSGEERSAHAAAYAAAYAAHAADAAAYAAHAIAAAYAAHAIVADIIESALIWWTHPPVEE